MKQWSFFLMILLVCSCGGKLPKKEKKAIHRRTSKPRNKPSVLDPIKIQEAKFSDIPSPLTAVPLTDYYHVDSGSALFAYRDKKMSANELSTFYLTEMERLGWCNRLMVEGRESMLYFEKPDRICIVSIRSFGMKCVDWVISTGTITQESS